MPSYVMPPAAMEAGTGSIKAVGLGRRVVRTGANIIGNVAACALMFAPLASFVLPMWQENAVGNRTAYGHVATFFSSVACILYGLRAFPDGLTAMTINIASAVLQMGYIAVFIWFAAGAAHRHTLYALAPVVIILTATTCLAITKVAVPSLIPVVALVATCLNYMSIGFDVVKVAMSGDVNNMDPVYEILFGLANAWSSAVFASLSTPPDLPIAILSTVGVAVLLVQLIVYIIYYNFEPQAQNLALQLQPLAPQPQPPLVPEPELPQPPLVPEPELPQPPLEPEQQPDLIYTIDVPDYGHELEILFTPPV